MNMKKTFFFLLVLVVMKLQGQTSKEVALVPEPSKIAFDSKDNLFVLLKYGIARITPDGTVTQFTKDNPNIVGGNFNKSTYIDRSWGNMVIDSKDNLYLIESRDKVIYKLSFLDNGKISFEIYAGDIWKYGITDGPRLDAKFTSIRHMAMDKFDNIYVTDDYNRIQAEVEANYVTDNFYQKDKKLKYIKGFSVVRKIGIDGKVTTLKNTTGKFVLPNGVLGMAIDNDGNIVYTTGGYARSVEKINVSSGVFSHVAGKPYKREWCPVYTPGDTSKAELFSPETIIVNRKGEIIYADERSHRITKIANGKVTTLAGNNIIDPCSQNIGGRAQEGYKDGKATTALFNFPKGLAYDSKGHLYIADQYNHCIRKYNNEGVVSSFTKPKL